MAEMGDVTGIRIRTSSVKCRSDFVGEIKNK